MRFGRAIMLSLSGAALLAGCSGDPSVDDTTPPTTDPSDSQQGEGVVLGTSWEALSYPYCMYGAWSDPDGDGWGWEFNHSCIVYKPPTTTTTTSTTTTSTSTTTSTTTTSTACKNPEGTDSIMAALAVSAANEIGRWQPTQDFAISNTSYGEVLVLTGTGRGRCADGVCANTQALLDFQKPEADGQVVFPGNVLLSAVALRSRLVAKFRDQQACEKQPSNGGTTNCPAEQHQLIFQRSEKGGCDTNYYFVAKKLDGTPLQYPAQLKNKLLWADRVNPYINFQSVGEVVSIDPTYGLDDVGATSTGACDATCAKISLRQDLQGACCSCLGVSKTFTRSKFNAITYLCQ
jgi:hypothetical protein